MLLLTGATGLVGSALLRRLTDAREPVRCLVRDPRRLGPERVRVPTLFVYGERDFAIVPETVAGVADYVDAPYTELRLARNNHWVQQESPAEVNAALLSFLDG